jgi:photosystem II stability/assembly factor-like uncharacterized protein
MRAISYLRLRPVAIGLQALFVSVSIGYTADAPTSEVWHVAGPWGGTATSVAVDPKNPQIILAGARNSLLFQSENSGETWRSLHFPKRQFGEVATILIDPLDTRHYLVGLIGSDRGGLFESFDAGGAWAPVADLQGFGVRALAAAPSDPARFAAASLHGVFLSKDSGKSWTKISDPNNLDMRATSAVAFDEKNPDIIYAGTSHLPWKTPDGGKTWESIHVGMIDDSDVFSIAVDKTTPEHIFASACSGIYASLDRGEQWHKLQGIPNTHRRTHIIRQDPGDRSVIYAGTTLGLFRSEDRGVTWRQLTHEQVNWLAFDPADAHRMYLAIESEGLMTSTDRGLTMKPLNAGFVDRRLNSTTVSGDRLVAVEANTGETSELFASSDKGEHWNRLGKSTGLEGVHLDQISGFPNDPKVLFAATPHRLFKSIDGGLTWKPAVVMVQTKTTVVRSAKPATVTKTGKKVPATEAKTVVTLGPPRVFPFHAVNGLYTIRNGAKYSIFAATDHGLIYTLDGGAKWALADMPDTGMVDALYISPSDGRIVAKASSLYFSEDFGEHWRSIGFPRDPGSINQIALSADPSAPWLAALTDGLFQSSDQGQHWYRIITGVPASTFNSVVYSPSEPTVAFAVGFGQLYESRDSGGSWASLSDGTPEFSIRRLWIPDGYSDRLFGLTNEFGLVFRNRPVIR